MFGLPNSKPKETQAQTAGCGSGWTNRVINDFAPLVPILGLDLTIAGKQFRVACNEHDTCYDTLGKSQEECDKAFHKRMLGICASDHNTIVGRPLRIACNGRADAFYVVVRDHGHDAYRDAQANARNSQPVASNSLNLVLDANNGNGNIYLYPKSDKNNSNHLWRIVGVTDGYHMIISKRNGYALDANGGTGNLYLHPKPDQANPNHLWKLTQLPGDYWLITSRVNGYALDANTGNGNLYLHPNPDTANPNHLWKFLYIDDYTIIGSRLKN